MKVLVTGGFGYVGGRICRHLAEIPDVELLISSRLPNRLAPDWLRSGRVISTVDDLKEGSQVWKGLDAVVHMATLNETISNRDPDAALQVNCLGTRRLVAAAAAAGVKCFVYFSTVHVYGTPLQGTLTESSLPRPVHPYAIAHRAAEDFVLAAGAGSGIRTVVLRLANAIGPPADAGVDRWTLLCNDLCRAAVQTRKLVLRTAGRQWRNFIALTDVCRAVEHLLRGDRRPGYGDIYNLASERNLRVLEMTQLIAERCRIQLGYHPEIVRPEGIDDSDESELEISVDRIKGTGFRFLSNLAEEIDSTLRFCAEQSDRIDG